MISPLLAHSLPVRFLEGFLADSLWMGFAAALCYGMFERMARRARPQVRYAAACAALLLTVAGPMISAFWRLAPWGGGPAQSPGYFLTVLSEGAAAVTGTGPQWIPARPSDWIQGLGPMAPLLVAAWAAGVVVTALRLAGIWTVVSRLRRQETLDIPCSLLMMFEHLAKQMGLTRPVQLVLSPHVAVPMAVGWLKPVVLVPASALTGLDPQWLEAVLAHELAHIRRHDALINLLQSFAETLLFHHPAVWWLGARIREEREFCCDDVAVQFCGGPAPYLAALVRLEESRIAPVPSAAMAANGGSLLARGRRLVLGESRAASPGTLGALAAALTIVAAVLLALVPSRPARATAEAPLTAMPASETLNRDRMTERLLVEANQRLQRTVTIRDGQNTLRNALMDIGRQSGLKIVFPLDPGTRQIQFPAGELRASEALTAALRNTGLEWHYSDGLTIQVVPAGDPDKASHKLVRFVAGLPGEVFKEKVSAGRADTIPYLTETLMKSDGPQMDEQMFLFVEDVLSRAAELATDGAVVTRIVVQAERDPVLEENLRYEVELSGWSGGNGLATVATGPAMEFSRRAATDEKLVRLLDAPPKLSLIGTPGSRTPQEFSLLLSGQPEVTQTNRNP
ncbi:MAG: M56 family metallopeptidase [Candidatus Sumerlaeaceae bacterium]|nr:M56 family metallopeptidase [Candidatus Sumerlaeaceae bacterium]